MSLEPDICYRALIARDTRFDGRFFVAVSSTRIYCRPVCTVKPPRRENCRFYSSAAAAESDGYRPCLRCRPELAPGNASVDAASRLARALANRIDDGALAADDLPAIARQLDVTDRHLRRAFRAEFGVTPVQYAQTQRLLLAKRLLTDTTLPIVEVAYASGFGSVRRFNALFKQRYRLQPTALRVHARSTAAKTGTGDTLDFELSFRPPYDWKAVSEFLGARAIAGVESADAQCYRRTVCLRTPVAEHRGWLEVRPRPGKTVLRVTLSASLVGAVMPVLARVKALMDLACHPADVARALGPWTGHDSGLRVPGAFDGFEVAVRAILGQQVSVAAASTLIGRFAAAFGDPIECRQGSLTTIFPAADSIARLPHEQIARLGVPGARARTVVALAGALADGRLRLSPESDVEATLAQLQALSGIGPWTAHYIAMRALGWPDAFPHTDLGVMRALGETNPRRVLALAEAWRPWRAYAVMRLWHGRSPLRGAKE